MPKISALPIASRAGTGDLLVLDQGLITKSIDFNVLQSAVANAGVVQSLISQNLSSALSNQNPTFGILRTTGPAIFGSGITSAGGLTLGTDLSPSLSLFSQTAIYPKGTLAFSQQQTVNVKDVPFNAKGDGVADDSAAWNAWGAALFAAASGSIQGGAIGVVPPGNYFFSSQVTLTLPNFGRATILAGGAEITTSGAISGLKITGGATGGGADIFGLQINHRGNAVATFGFDHVHASNVKLYDCYVRAHNNQAGYAPYHYANSDPADDNTGSIWNSLINCGEGMDSGGDGSNVPFGVLYEGAANANRVLGGQYGRNTTECVKMQPHAGQTTVGNGLVIDGASFEGYTTAIRCDGLAASTFTGLRVINCRFESGTTIFSLTGSTTQPATYPFFAGNYIVPGAGGYINNPNNLQYISLDNLLFTVNQITSLSNLILNIASGAALVVQLAGTNKFSFDGLDFKPAVNGAVNIGTQILRWGAGNFLGQLSMGDKIFAGAPSAQPQAIVGMYMGTGLPSNAFGNNLDFYLRGDGGLGSTIFVKRLGSWTVA